MESLTTIVRLSKPLNETKTVVLTNNGGRCLRGSHPNDEVGHFLSKAKEFFFMAVDGIAPTTTHWQ
jgi:hypothetical protein